MSERVSGGGQHGDAACKHGVSFGVCNEVHGNAASPASTSHSDGLRIRALEAALADAQETLQDIYDLVDPWEWIPERGDVKDQADRCLARIRVQLAVTA